MVDRLFPHQVELDAETVSKNTHNIALFYSQVGIDWPDRHARLVWKDDRDFNVYSFADPQNAAQFQALFGGVLAPLTRHV
jgi:hypothetical protein